MPLLWVVIPCFNEEQVLPETSKRLAQVMRSLVEQGKIDPESKIVYVDDGSKDNTWKLIEEMHHADAMFMGIHLSRNFGHQNALLAGLMTAKEHADISISMDADLQDDIGVIEKFVALYQEGNEVVYGVRKSRDGDTFFKKHSAQQFYKFMSFLGVELVYNHADCRLLGKRALEALSQYPEVNLFLRGMVPQLGYRHTTVEYERGKRYAGESKYPLKKMLRFAFEGITSFSIKPIRFITMTGVFFLGICIVLIIYFLIRYFTHNTVSGWTSTVMSIWTLGSIQLISIGTIGEYIGKTYLETKHRPKYIIDEII
ncbi:MAG: polyisoprenyl-phosphate glycosyltransferase [Clostridiales bacterium]|nr:polyisoprenyl-phosphate glycosyltransferase [Clostridiales bacterium]